MAEINDSVCEGDDELCTPMSREDEAARDLLDKLNKSEENNVCADCGKNSKCLLKRF